MPFNTGGHSPLVPKTAWLSKRPPSPSAHPVHLNSRHPPRPHLITPSPASGENTLELMGNSSLCIKKLHGASTEVGGCWFAAGTRGLTVDTDLSTLPLTMPPSLSELQPQDLLGVSLKGQHLSCHRAWASLPPTSAHTPPPAFLLPSHTSRPNLSAPPPPLHTPRLPHSLPLLPSLFMVLSLPETV